ncbi:unnamed protein product [Mytilus coruscus]|uniref:Uncharacterized protein n=1 Tax=Mytilus coruscus TaxID=42192 RepID=A0A6J8F109_MYTCO|nr:unnamed protein product [Mytilus coruscus]
MNWMYHKFVIYISVIFLFLYEFSEELSGDSQKEFNQRFPDRSFPNHNLIYERNVTCGEHSKGSFPSQTWTCADVKVNNLRMAYGLYEGIDTKCTETKGFDELAELCRQMMRSIEVKRTLWAAIVSNASCDYHNENRVLLNRTKENFVWHDMTSGFGWIHTIQCMAMRT